MRLHYSIASPYARKVIALAIETGLERRIEMQSRTVSPIKPAPEVVGDNPLGKIPCLVTDDGAALFDSRVICEYLDALHDGRKMFPAQGAARWTALRRQGQADGLLDAALLTRYETTLRPEERRWPEWIEGQKQKFRRAADAFEVEAESLGETVDIGTLALGCALGYLDFRFADEGWRSSRPKLAAWFERFAKRPSLARSAPKEVR